MSGNNSEVSDYSNFWSPIYEPLPGSNYLRTLVLLPGNHEDDIECSLKIQTYRRLKGKYAAISYVWGDPNNTTTIICNGCRVQITKSLADALRQFRHPRTIRRLWADAICINQADFQEKAIQVGKMGEVFRNAMEVLVWLGNDTEGIAKDCFQMIETTNKYLGGVYIENGTRYSAMPKLKPPYPIPLDKESWLRVRTLLWLPWFGRAWTVQECALAQRSRMYWGMYDIDIADVFEISLWSAYHIDLRMILQEYKLLRFSNSINLFMDIHCCYRGRDQWLWSRPTLARAAACQSQGSLARVLFSGRHLLTTDPRDHVFAFLECPFAKDESSQPILEADYSAPTDEIWYRVACRLVRHPREGRWLLSAVKRASRDVIMNSNRPSWVPYWDDCHWASMLALPISKFEAGGPRSLFSAFVRKGKVLDIPGIIFDSVVWMSDEIEEDGFTLDEFRDLNTHIASEPLVDALWRETSLAADKMGFTLNEDAFTMTLMRNQDCPGNQFKLDSHREEFKAFCEVARSNYRYSGMSAGQQLPDETLRRKAIIVMNMLNSCSIGKRLVLTEKGRVGLTPANLVRVGDLCCVFSGVTVPFLLTPAANRRYKLVDECYVFGVMQGQLLEEHEPVSILLE